MAQDLGEVVISLDPDEAKTTRVYDKAGKGAAVKFVREMDRGIRRLVSNAAAIFGGAKGRGAANLVIAGIPPLGGAVRGAGGRAAGTAARIGPAGLAAGAVIALAAAATLAVRAINKFTKAEVRRLSSVSPVLARVQAEGAMQNLRQRIITARMFEASLASSARTLQLAKAELFKVKLVLSAVKVTLGDIAARVGLATTKFISFLVVELPLRYKILIGSIKIGVFNMLAAIADFFIPGKVGDTVSAALRMQVKLAEEQNKMMRKILKMINDLATNATSAAHNDIMLMEVRRMAGLPVNPRNDPMLYGFDPTRPSSQTSQGVPATPGR